MRRSAGNTEFQICILGLSQPGVGAGLTDKLNKKKIISTTLWDAREGIPTVDQRLIVCNQMIAIEVV